MTLPRRRFLRLAGAVAALPMAARRAIAQAYPTRPVRWIVGYPAGGATDTVMRIVGNVLSERLGQPVVIENRPGAATNLAAQAVVTAPPDGYTLLFAATTNAINATLYETLPFNFLRDIAPVSGLVEMPLVLVATRRSRQRRSRNSSPMPKPIRGPSMWPRSGPARSRIWPSNCSRR